MPVASTIELHAQNRQAEIATTNRNRTAVDAQYAKMCACVHKTGTRQNATTNLKSSNRACAHITLLLKFDSYHG